MTSYLQRFEATPEAQRWPLVRGWMLGEPLPFYAELRRDRPILAMEAVRGLTRAVPIALVQDWFGWKPGDPDLMIKWSYWAQLDTFWNQPFDAIAWPDPDKIHAEAQVNGLEMVAYLVGLIAIREG